MNQPIVRHHRYSYEEYLSHEEVSNVKHEYLNGEIYAMASGSRQHAALAMAIGSALVQQPRGGPCVVYSSDLRSGYQQRASLRTQMSPSFADPRKKMP